MVEGHTDDVPIQNEVLLDNWDLSVKRATSIVRILQNDFGVPPERMTAAGRSFFMYQLQITIQVRGVQKIEEQGL